jgi:hypothetical protein
MKQIIQDQTVSFDTHQAGDGRKVDVDQLHMHKRMNGKKFKGVNIKIPLDPNKSIDYTGNNSKEGQRIINEIRKVLKKNPGKVREMAKFVANRISRYTDDMTAENSKEFLDKTANALAKHFELNDKISESMTQEINNHLSFYITSHLDNEGNIYYIKQDITRKRIKIGDDLEQLFYGNENRKGS